MEPPLGVVPADFAAGRPKPSDFGFLPRSGALGSSAKGPTLQGFSRLFKPLNKKSAKLPLGLVWFGCEVAPFPFQQVLGTTWVHLTPVPFPSSLTR